MLEKEMLCEKLKQLMKPPPPPPPSPPPPPQPSWVIPPLWIEELNTKHNLAPKHRTQVRYQPYRHGEPSSKRQRERQETQRERNIRMFHLHRGDNNNK